MKLLKQQAYLSSVKGNYLEASEQFSHILALGDTSQFKCKHHGQNFYNNGQFTEAIYWLDKYLKMEPDDSQNQFILGLAYQKDYQYEKSLEHFQKALTLVYDKELISRVYSEKGIVYSLYGDYFRSRDSTGLKAPEMYKSAMENYLQAIELVPTNFELYRDLGILYEKKIGDLEKALNCYEKYNNELNKENADIQDVIWIQNKITYLKALEDRN